MCRESFENTARLAGVLMLASLLRQCSAFVDVRLFGPAASSSPSFRQPQQTTPMPPYRHAAADADIAAARPRKRAAPSSVLLFSPDPQSLSLGGNTNSAQLPRSTCSSMSCEHDDHERRQRQRRRRLAPHRQRPGDACRNHRMYSSTSLCAVGRGGADTSTTPAATSPPGEEEGAQELEAQGEGGRGLKAAAGSEAAGAPKKKKEKSVLGKAGDALKATFNAFMAASTVLSLVLAAEALWQLHGTPLTLSNAVPTLTKLIPLTGLGVFGAAQLVGLLARVVRVIVTLPIMLSGTWVILQNAPKLLPHGSDLTGAGSLAALLATPEVLEAAAVLALIGGTGIWALNFATGAVGSLLSAKSGDSPEEDEDDELA